MHETTPKTKSQQPPLDNKRPIARTTRSCSTTILLSEQSKILRTITGPPWYFRNKTKYKISIPHICTFGNKCLTVDFDCSRTRMYQKHNLASSSAICIVYSYLKDSSPQKMVLNRRELTQQQCMDKLNFIFSR